MLQAIIIQDAVIDSFTCGTLTVDFSVLLRIPRDTRLEAQLSFIFIIHRAAITVRGAFCFIWAGIHAPTFVWTGYLWAPFTGSFPHEHILCPAPQMEWPHLSKVIPSGAFSEDFARPLISIRALISQRSSNS